MLQALLFSGIYECLLVGALFLVVHTLISLWTGLIVWLGLLAMGYSSP